MLRILKTVALILVCLFATAVSTTRVDADPVVYAGGPGIGQGKHIVFIANDHEYRSEEACPLLAKMMSKHYGFKCTVIFGVDEQGNIEAGGQDLPGLEALADADLLFLFSRFMNLPDEQIDLLVDYFERGGPVVGLRTSTHAFHKLKGKWEKLNFKHKGDDYRGGFGEQVFGNTWDRERGQSHYGGNHSHGSRITPVAGAVDHPINRGVRQIHAYSGAYKSQVPAGATPLVEVQVLSTFGPSDEIKADKPIVNAGWTRDSYTAPSGAMKKSRVVYTSFGASEDMLSADARRFLVNSSLWAMQMEDQITADLEVGIVGVFRPSPYCSGLFGTTGVSPSELAELDGPIMPESADRMGFDGDYRADHLRRVLEHRPEWRAMLQAKYPDLVEGMETE